MVERAAQEAKKLLNKTAYGTAGFYNALLEWRNTPRDKLLQSPVQRLMRRTTRTQLPVHTKLLEPKTVPPKQVTTRLKGIRQRQKTYNNRGTRDLALLHPGSEVTVFNSRNSEWHPAIVVSEDPTQRSYIVANEHGEEFRRNRGHI
ncbi:hypothetical protein HPB52_014050 [Rhipicephalus sanguineus]|uniref:Uncharacterized protein n=1 Tax=Rhipicephalus sanguineus TaxID=34632 RepID=A0A9D4Q0B7_RHISA|nr:hypothetical protein HPB52_014050 [Rhipicephalus sanguineus]